MKCICTCIIYFTGDRDQDHPCGKEMQKSKMAVWEALQITVKRREAKSKGEKERYKHLSAEFQRIARRDKKAFFSYQCKEIEERTILYVSTIVHKIYTRSFLLWYI